MATTHSAVDVKDIEEIRLLFLEYQSEIGVDLCFQGFANELATLPGEYSPPSGRLLLTVDGNAAIGCVALRALSNANCEMKRLYVRPAARGRGIGELLARGVLSAARQIGYKRIFLDTLPSMSAARALYHSLGFTEAPPYCHNPVPGVSYLALDLGIAAPLE
ncbi:MAG: GNAT family N-acetyltransferase [Burkholderiales bacterium]